VTRLTICLTHDVDRTNKTYQYLTRDLRQLAFSRLSTLLSRSNPYWCFPSIQRIEQSHGVRSTFFFLDESIAPRLFSPNSWKLALGRYSLRSPDIQEVISDLHLGGWEIAVHGSYLSYRSLELLEKEKQLLESVLGSSVVGVRQHYLNLDIPETWKLHHQAGFSYDASFGLKRGIGPPEGRTGPFLDSDSGMVVIPLSVMEANLWQHANHQAAKAEKILMDLLDEAEAGDGLFCALWHQRYFNSAEFPGFSDLYEFLIVEGLRRGARFLRCRDVYEEFVGDAA